MAFNFTPTKIGEVIEITPDIFGDSRGSFVELFKGGEFAQQGMDFTIQQINYSTNQKNVLRGLHYQINPVAQGKMVTVVKGSIYDVVVDLRVGSPTENQWVALELNASEHHLLYVPKGFAHGFLALEDETEVLYYVNDIYSPEHERGIIWNDSQLAIDWPMTTPLLSDKDAVFPALREADKNFVYSTAV